MVYTVVITVGMQVEMVAVLMIGAGLLVGYPAGELAG